MTDTDQSSGGGVEPDAWICSMCERPVHLYRLNGNGGVECVQCEYEGEMEEFTPLFREEPVREDERKKFRGLLFDLEVELGPEGRTYNRGVADAAEWLKRELDADAADTCCCGKTYREIEPGIKISVAADYCRDHAPHW